MKSRNKKTERDSPTRCSKNLPRNTKFIKKCFNQLLSEKLNESGGQNIIIYVCSLQNSQVNRKFAVIESSSKCNDKLFSKNCNK